MFFAKSNVYFKITFTFHMSHSEEFFHRKRRHRMRFWALVLALGVFVVGAATVSMIGLVAEARGFEHDIFGVQSALVERDFGAAGERLASARDRMDRVQNVMRLSSFLRVVPVVGQQQKSAQVLVNETESLLDTVGVFVSIGIDIEQQLRATSGLSSLEDIESFYALSPEERSEIILTLQRAVPDLEETHVRVQQSRTELEELSDVALGPGLGLVHSDLLENVVTLDQALELTIPWLQILPEAGGFNGSRNYLVLLQNTGELRPTGGFWGTYGVMKIENGEVQTIETDDIYALDVLAIGNIDTQPPEPLKKYLGVDTWYMRDINWSPDVPAAVKDGLDAYRRQTSFANSPTDTGTLPVQDFDGAILVTPAVGERLLAALGPATIGDVLFTDETLFDVLEYEVEVGFRDKDIAREDRKDIVGTLINILLDRIQGGGTEVIPSMIQVGVDSLNEQDLVFYHEDPDLQRVFEQHNWAGDVRVSARSDHFMVVDANMAALKTDAVMNRSYNYSIEKLFDGRYQASLQVNYDHPGDFDYRTTRYRTYTRVYVPHGSELVRVDGALEDDRLKNPSAKPGSVQVSQAFGATVFGAFTSVEPGASGSMTFHYILPDHIVEQIEAGSYTLTAQRQIGVGNVPVTLELDFDKNLTAAEPGENRQFWHDDRYSYTTSMRPFQTFNIWF